MDLTEMLGDLALDLKATMGTEVSIAGATRAVNRAVDDLSRHIPRERIYEHTWIEAVIDDSFTTPATADPVLIVSAWTFNGEISGATVTMVGYFLDVPRPLSFLITDANNSITRATILVKGIDGDGVYREERFYRHNGKSQTGKVYFHTIYQIVLTEVGGTASAADTLSIGTAAPDTAGAEVWIQLSNPIEPDSETIYSAALKTGTKYTKDTDYRMDYSNGRICIMAAGSMAVSTTYYANYNRHNLSIDVSPILNDLTRITKVLYPADKVPEQQVAYSIWENMMTVGSQKSGESQKRLVDGEHLAIYYESKHTPPTYVGSGSYPGYLDQVVLIGAGGYTLLMMAVQYEHQAATDLGTATTGLLGALANATKYLNNNTNADAAGLLQDITDYVAYLRDMIVKSTDGTGALADGNAYLDKVASVDIDVGAVGATAWLLEGELLINKLNDGGPDVATKFADYARAKLQIGQTRIQGASGFFQEAAIRLDNVRSYMEQAAGYDRIAEAFLLEASKYGEAVENDMLLADRFRVEGNNRLGEFHEVLKSRAEYRKRLVDVSVRQPA